MFVPITLLLFLEQVSDIYWYLMDGSLQVCDVPGVIVEKFSGLWPVCLSVALIFMVGGHESFSKPLLVHT
jgi:hypothetical protein